MAREISNNDFILKEDLPDDDIKTVQFVTLLDLVSDGAEIEGFSTPSKEGLQISATDSISTDYIQAAQKDIFLDGTPIRSFGGVENIPNTSISLRVGKENQTIMSGVNELRQSVNVSGASIAVKNNKDPEQFKKSVTINQGIDINSIPRAVIVTLTWNSLRQTDRETGKTNPGLGINFGPHRSDENRPEGNDTSKGGNGERNFNNSVLPRIRIKDTFGNVIQNKFFKVNGRSMGRFSKDFRIDIVENIDFTNFQTASSIFPLTLEVLRDDTEFRVNPTIGNGPFDDDGELRLEEGTLRFTEFFLTSVQVVTPQIPTKTEFKNTAYIGLRYSAEQFPNIPQRKYFIRGIKVKVPTGTNNGTVPINSENGRILYPANPSFQELTTDKHWTSDPVWILYALLTEDYGLGISDLKIDKASFFAASLYCATPVKSDEIAPRYSFNGVIKTRKKALEIVREIAGMIRATLYYRNGSLKIAIDKPETVVSYLFTNANVVDGLFNYSGVNRDKKFNQVNVSYFNNEIQDKDVISVRNSIPPLKDLNQTNIQSLYTTDRKQAIRFGKSILYTSNFETEVVTFECGIEAACILEPFQIIKIADRTKEIIRASGRIKTVTSSTVLVVDDSTNTSVGIVGDVFSVIDKNGGVQERTIDAVSGSTITLSSALAPEPQAGGIWAVKTGNVQHRKYRVTNIKQKDNFVFSITAIIYDDNKYDFIDREDSTNFGVGLKPTTLLDPIPSPSIAQVEEQLVVVNSRAQSQIVLDFGHVNGARSYQVTYTEDGGDPIVNNVKTNQFIIKNNKAAFYTFTVRSITSAFTLSSPPTTTKLDAVGLRASPNPVTNLRAEESGDNLILKFDRSTDLDVLFGGFVDVKLSLISDGTATLQDANPEKRVNGDVNEIIFNDYQSGEYFLKFLDVKLNESETAASVVVNRTIASNNLVAAQIRENTNNFAGSKVNLEYDSGIGGLRLSSAITFDSITNFDTLTVNGISTATLDLVTAGGGSGIPSEGIYTFAANDIDLGAPFRFHVEPHFKKSGFDTAGQWDSYTDNMDDWPNIFTGSTTVVEKSADLVFQVAKSQTATASTTFETFVNTDMIARTLTFRVLVQNQSTYENVDIEELGVNLIFRPRTERSIDYQFNSSDNVSVTNGVLTSSSSGATTVSFVKKFFTGTTAIGGSTDKFKPVISININNMQSGDYFTISNVTSSQFDVSIKNGSSFVARQFTYSAFGYGEG
tara:strand:- start:1508 stop:5176 length:3669 start_codon:yes stop_codon:yes gene_type:complete